MSESWDSLKQICKKKSLCHILDVQALKALMRCADLLGSDKSAYTGPFPAILGKGPWLEFGKNMRHFGKVSTAK